MVLRVLLRSAPLAARAALGGDASRHMSFGTVSCRCSGRGNARHLARASLMAVLTAGLLTSGPPRLGPYDILLFATPAVPQAQGRGRSGIRRLSVSASRSRRTDMRATTSDHRVEPSRPVDPRTLLGDSMSRGRDTGPESVGPVGIVTNGTSRWDLSSSINS